MRNKIFASLFIISTLLSCSFQSKEEAVKEMCDVPENLLSDPTQIGPYLYERISNPEVRTIISECKDVSEMKAVLKESNIAPKDCGLLKFQSKGEAVKEMCNIPEHLLGNPAAVGPYLSSKIRNKEIRTLLSELEDINSIKVVLKEFNISPKDCGFLKIK